MSAIINMGNNTPVEAFSPNTKAKITTIRIPIPLMPDFDSPNKKTANTTDIHCKVDKLYEFKISR